MKTYKDLISERMYEDGKDNAKKQVVDALDDIHKVFAKSLKRNEDLSAPFDRKRVVKMLQTIIELTEHWEL